MKNIGVWLDKEKAHIIAIENNGEKFTTIQSKVENYRPVGGSRSKTRWGPQDVIQDSKFLEREQHQMKAYFKKIASQLKTADAIVIFGPAESNQKFKKELQENYKAISTKVKAVKKSDSMTDNQLIAWVKEFFDSKKH